MTTTLEQTKAAIMAKAHAEIAKAEKECAIRESLPIPPKSVHVYPLWGTAAGVTYEVKTKADALEILKRFAVIPAFVCRNDRMVAIKPFDDEAATSTAEIMAWVDIDQHGAKLKFFAKSGPDTLRVEISLPLNIFGAYRRSDLRAKVNFTMDWVPLSKTMEMFRAVIYARTYPRGPQSGNQIIYVLYDLVELENQFSVEVTK